MSASLSISIYDDPRVYDLMFGAHAGGQSVLKFYLRSAQGAGPPVLGLGCGNERRVSAKWLEGDCRDFDLGHQYGLIFLPATSPVHFTDRTSAEACFACVRKHRAAGGKLAVDIYSPSFPLLLRDPAERYPIGQYADPNGRGEVAGKDSNVYNAAAQINRSRWSCQTAASS